MSLTQRVVLCSFLVFGAQFVQATTINGDPTGISDPTYVIAFDEVTLVQDALATGQMHSGPDMTTPPIAISLDSLVDAAAFAAIDKGSSRTLEALRGGVGLIDFTGKQFDTRRLTGPDPIAMDTLPFSLVSTIPEPATFLLLGSALVCAGALRRLKH